MDLAPGASLASEHDLVILDLDGVVYLGTDAVPGAAAAIGAITGSGATPVVYATNNASRTAEEVAALLRDLGVAASADDVLTSAQATAQSLAHDLPPAAPVLVVGSDALRGEIAAVGLTPVTTAAHSPIAVAQGYGPDVGWSDLAEACVAVRAGARWVATNTDATLPSTRGPLPGNGALVAALAHALGGRRPDSVVGKPGPTLFEVAARARGACRALVVGDRLDTDVRGAVAAGMSSLLVLTGVHQAADLLRAVEGERPNHVAADLGALCGPSAGVRVPVFDTGLGARTGGWRADHDGDRVVLAGSGDRIAALRALAAAAWAHPRWTALTPIGDDADRAVRDLGLGDLIRP